VIEREEGGREGGRERERERETDLALQTPCPSECIVHWISSIDSYTKTDNHKPGTHLNTVARLSTAQVPSHIKTDSLDTRITFLYLGILRHKTNTAGAVGYRVEAAGNFLLPNRSAGPIFNI
jgi:hypothetical protein